ncbi:MAG: hypothetical protein R3D25_13870 [Geminicoccaceae bacterium]
MLAVMVTATLLTAVGCTEARQAASSAWPVEPALGAAEVEPAAVDSLASSYLAGRIALADGDLRIAADNLGNALDLDPDNLELRREVFALRLGVGDYPAALALAGTLVEIDPDAEDAQLMLVLESVQAGDFAAAGAALPEVADRRASSASPSRSSAPGSPSAPATRRRPSTACSPRSATTAWAPSASTTRR